MSSDWKQYRPKLAFYDVLDKPGGVSVEQALRRAGSAVEAHRSKANAELAKTLSELEALTKGRTPEHAAQIYERAAYMLDIADMFEAPLCRAANSLCELATRMQAAGRWDWPSVDVHISAMRLLIGKRADDEAGVRSVLNGLAGVVAKFPDPSSEAHAVAAPVKAKLVAGEE